ncbi:MAG: hypothetical protein R3F55_18990 [Alphaproteobacteria bacterium]
MRAWLRMALAVLALGSAVPAAARADEAEANRLLVQAIALAAQARQVPAGEAGVLYARAVAELDRIVAEHPDSSVAVLLATGQPIGSFRPWEVRHELARLSGASAGASTAAAETPALDCAAPCTWRLHFASDGRVLRGGSARILSSALNLRDHDIVIVGTDWIAGEKSIWLGRYAADGATVVEGSAPGTACDAAAMDGGIAVLADGLGANGDPGVQVFGDDGGALRTSALGFEPRAIEPDGRGGYFVGGQRDDLPVVAAFDADGTQRWVWTGADEQFREGATVFVGAMTALPDGGVRLLGVEDMSGTAPQNDLLWTLAIDGDGNGQRLVGLQRLTVGGGPLCNLVERTYAIHPLGDGFVLHFLHFPQPGTPQWTVAWLDAAAAELWRRDAPVRPAPEAMTDEIRNAGFDQYSAIAPDGEDGLFVAGFTTRPMRRGSGFVAHWDDDGNEVWRTELRMVADDEPAELAHFAEVAATADGGVVAAMTDGLESLRINAYVFRLGANGETR